MGAKVTLEMSISCYKKLADFLTAHEWEITVGENAYGELRELFILVFDVEPEEK